MKIKVEDIIIKINNLNHELLNKELLKYETSLKEGHVFNINLVNHLSLEEKIEGLNPYIKVIDNITYKYYYNKKGIISLITHDPLYKKVSININESILTDINSSVYIFLGIMFIELAIEYNYLPLHGSALFSNNKTFIISAPSGTGKSTLRRHIAKLDSNLVIINDDKPLLKIKDNKVLVIGSPFSGEDMLNTNRIEKLETIIFLKQGPINKRNELSKDLKLELLLKNIYKPKNDLLWDFVIKSLEAIVNNINIVEIEVINDISAANFVLEVINSF